MAESNPQAYQELIDRIVKRDELAYQQLFYQFYKDLVHYGYTIVQDQGSAEDIVADLFLKIWTMEERLLDVQHLPFYLYRAVRNKGISQQKSGARITYGDPDIEQVEFHTPENILISKENINQIQYQVNNLPPRCRQVFTLIRDNGLSYQEVAELLEISIHTVNRHMQEALHKLHTSLKK